MGLVGVKETKEVLVAVNELAIVLIGVLKDGPQLSDALEIYNKISTDENFRSAILLAADQIGKVPAEVGELDLAEAVDLAGLQLSYLPKIAAALKA